MLIHEIPEGEWGDVGGRVFVRPPGAHVAFVVPDHVTVVREPDGTLTLMGPLHHMKDSVLRSCFLIHDEWFCLEMNRR